MTWVFLVGFKKAPRNFFGYVWYFELHYLRRNKWDFETNNSQELSITNNHLEDLGQVNYWNSLY